MMGNTCVLWNAAKCYSCLHAHRTSLFAGTLRLQSVKRSASRLGATRYKSTVNPRHVAAQLVGQLVLTTSVRR
jgi:hypothetical protein